MTTTTSNRNSNSNSLFLQDFQAFQALQALDFDLFWNDPTIAAEVKLQTNTNEAALMAMPKKKKPAAAATAAAKNCNHRFHSQDWSEVVNKAIFNLRHLPRLRAGEHFESSQLFSSDGCRYTVRSKMIQVFEIFPWFLLTPQPPPNHRYRESLTPKKAEHIESVTAAVNYFWSQPLGEADLSSLRDYFLQKGGAPQRTLWALVDLRSFIEKDRLHRLTAGAQSEIQELSSRLFALEEKVRMLQQTVLSQGRQPPNRPIAGKRKLDSLSSSNDANEISKIQRVAVLEQIVDGLVVTMIEPREKLKLKEKDNERDREGETSDDDASSCGRDDEVCLSEFESDGSVCGVDLPYHYLDEISLEEYHLQQQQP
jgi:hypothetical protein